MVATWPITLPQSPLVDNYSEGKGQGRRFSQTDTGPGKVFRKTSSAGRPLKCSFFMTNAQLSIFELFFRDDIDEGSLPFNLPNPRGAGSFLVRFKADAVPDWQSPNGGLHWYVKCELEILP